MRQPALVGVVADEHVAIGEIGLGGEIRFVQQLEQRIHEASQLGFGRVICPATRQKIKSPRDCELVPVATLDQAMEQLN